MRQKIRKTLLVFSFLLFPITIWYFSPYLIIQAASEHIMNGSFIVFVTMLVCISCGKCNKTCPMGLDVKTMVTEEKNAKCTECIQCGACIDACPRKVLKYKLRWR